MDKRVTAGLIVCILLPMVSLAGTPGVDALIENSTDIIIAKVTSTNPRKALEGARDTVRLQVICPLKGPLLKDDAIGVYYHLLWVDTKTWKLEPTKFAKGKYYILFLKSHTVQRKGKKSTEHELTDRWLSVQQNHPDLVKSILSRLNKKKRTCHRCPRQPLRTLIRRVYRWWIFPTARAKPPTVAGNKSDAHDSASGSRSKCGPQVHHTRERRQNHPAAAIACRAATIETAPRRSAWRL